MEANNVLTNLKNKNKHESESNIQFRKNRIRLYLRIVAIVLFLIISILLGIYLFNKWRSAYTNNDDKIKSNRPILITDSSGDIQLKIGLDGIGEIDIDNCVIVNCGDIREIGLLTNDNQYLITSFKLVNIKQPIFVELPSDKILKGTIIEQDKLKGLIIVKMQRYTDDEEFIEQLDPKQYVYYKQIVDTNWKIYLEKQLNMQNIVIGNQKVYCVSVPNKLLSGSKAKTGYSKYNSGMILCNQFGAVLGADFVNDTAGIGEGSYSFVDKKYINDAIDRQLDNTYSTLKKWGILVKEAKDAKGNIDGIYINNIDKKSPLYGIGIYPTDIILEVQGKKIINVDHLARTLENSEKDYRIYFKIISDGNISVKSFKLNN